MDRSPHNIETKFEIAVLGFSKQQNKSRLMYPQLDSNPYFHNKRHVTTELTSLGNFAFQ